MCEMTVQPAEPPGQGNTVFNSFVFLYKIYFRKGIMSILLFFIKMNQLLYFLTFQLLFPMINVLFIAYFSINKNIE